MKLVLTPGKSLRILIGTVLGLTIIGTLVQFSKYVLGHDYLLGLLPLFDLSSDTSVPSWYSAIALLICAVLLVTIWTAKREEKDPFALHWGGLAIIFLYLSLDEAARIHETIGNTLVLKFGETHGLFHYTWVIYGMVLVLLVAVAYIRFLWHLPFRTMVLFVIAGGAYVGGALVMEMVNARYGDIHGSKNLAYQMMTVVEESLEMFGIVIFIYALLSYASTKSPKMRTVQVEIEEDSSKKP